MNTQLRTTSGGGIRADRDPIISIISNVDATDAWEAEGQEPRMRTDCGSCITVALACGANADAIALDQLTPMVLSSDTDPSAIGSFFRWLTPMCIEELYGAKEVHVVDDWEPEKPDQVNPYSPIAQPSHRVREWMESARGTGFHLP